MFQQPLPLLSLIFALINLITCHNRDLIPIEAPTNLTLLELKARQAVIEWDAIDPETVRGTFRGYVVRTWNHAGSQAYAFPSDITRANVEFFPYSKNFITVAVRNEKYIGPPSEAISFDAPQIEPTPPQSIEMYPLSNQSVLLKWKKPIHANGILIGYKIYVNMVDNGLSIDDNGNNEVSHEIYDPDKLQAKLTGMMEGVKYRIEIVAINCAGESRRKSSEIVLKSYTPSQPSIPKLIYKINYKPLDVVGKCSNQNQEITPDVITTTTTTTTTTLISGIGHDYDYFDYVALNETQEIEQKQVDEQPTIIDHNDNHCLVDCMIIWLPDIKNVPGEYFYLKYRQRGSGDGDFIKTEPEYNEDFIILNNFNACKNYEIILVAVDGDYRTESTTITTPTKIFF